MIHLATAPAHPALTADDRLLTAELTAAGIDWRVLDWHDAAATVRVQPGDLVVIRSCWDYHLAAEAFVAWLHELQHRGARIANGDDVAGTLHKRYLLDIADRGLAPIPPTELLARGSDHTLDALIAAFGTTDLVIKPAISLSAHGTWRVDREAPSTARRRFATQLQHSDLLVQPYLPAIEHNGELSLVFFGGRYSHAVRKRPRAGDFRVQLDHGGRFETCAPAPPVVAAADRLLAGYAPAAAYARVDGVVVDDHMLLMELELIDPVLYLGAVPGAAARFAAALVDGVAASGDADIGH